MERGEAKEETRTVTVVSNEYPYAVVALDARATRGTIRLAFAEAVDEAAPVSVRVRDPSGRIVVERVLRELPTQGSEAGALRVPLSGPGDYLVEVRAITTLVDASPERDPWELDPGTRRTAIRVTRPSSARVRVA